MARKPIHRDDVVKVIETGYQGVITDTDGQWVTIAFRTKVWPYIKALDLEAYKVEVTRCDHGQA